MTLLLRGDTRADARLMPGDAIFVPPIGATVSVDGEVRRPAIYEIKGERAVSEIVCACWRAHAERESNELAPGARGAESRHDRARRGPQ